jgi:hypothetical protein
MACRRAAEVAHHVEERQADPRSRSRCRQSRWPTAARPARLADGRPPAAAGVLSASANRPSNLAVPSQYRRSPPLARLRLEERRDHAIHRITHPPAIVASAGAIPSD